ncbi:MAG: 16S rRNA (guanine(527)-N(7))-methyltransferase RsmG [Lachnospiraceae bacterium]|nr:16S rRNA (guanine(527)-N(7))-methyltransferase RsmG [Lachnospiraceae bacterium]
MEKRDNSAFLADLKEWKIELNETQLMQLEKYYEMLVEKNKVMNLTAITEYEDVLKKHFLDSLALNQLMKLDGKMVKVLDMGTGAGFPGIPLKIAFPQLEITLMDSLNKRIVFLQEVISELGLSGITAIHGRAEEAALKPEFREKYDLCVSRAVARLASLSEFCLPFVKQGGCFIPYKSGEIKEELQEAKFAIRELGGEYRKTYEYKLPNSDIERTMIQIEKINHTPKKYPRAGGKPLKQPLISEKNK